VVGGDHEVQPGRSCSGRDLGGEPLTVGVHRVQMAVAPVPGAAAALGPPGRVVGCEAGARRAVRERDLDLVVHALRRDLVRAEDDVPGAGLDRAGQVAGRGLAGADLERGAEAAGPAAEALAAELGAPLVEDADVAGVARRARRDGRLVVGVLDGDLLYALRYLHREVHEVRRAGLQVPRDDASHLATGRRGALRRPGGGSGLGEGDRGEGESCGAGGGGHQQPAAVEPARARVLGVAGTGRQGGGVVLTTSVTAHEVLISSGVRLGCGQAFGWWPSSSNIE
jgi:hypothetical protein